MITLGIETSCDETALALLETHGQGETFEYRVVASLVHSQADLHSAYGGVYPSLAKREHGKNLVPLLKKLLDMWALPGDSSRGAASLTSSDFNTLHKELKSQNPDLSESFTNATFLESIPPIDQIAVTEGPGLEPALWVGINFARLLSTLWNIPVFPINHMEGHVLGSLLESDTVTAAWHKLKPLPIPAVALLISGGHTELVRISAAGSQKLEDPSSRLQASYSYEIIGQTKDDAVGEAFDKAARLLGLPYPGGPHISKLAHEAWEQKIPSPVKLPRPMITSGDLQFSFSGLKTAVLYAVRANSNSHGALSDEFKKGIAHEFEQAVADTLDAKLRAAIDQVSAQAIIIGGGVSANHVLRERFTATAKEFNVPIYLPSPHISGDNALMIALAGSIHKEPPLGGGGSLKAHGTKRLGA